MMNNSLGNLRAFRAAVVLLLIAFTHACTKSPLDNGPAGACPGECSAQMLFPVQKDVNGLYHINLNWDREYLPYFTIDLIASVIRPEYRYNGVSVVTAEFYSETSWTLENSGVEVDIIQDTHVYFKDNGLNLTSKRIVGPLSLIHI